jgi:hypothetical protein
MLSSKRKAVITPQLFTPPAVPFDGLWLTPPKSVRLAAIAGALREDGFHQMAD